MASASPTVRRRQLGRELKRLREEAGKTREDAARHLDMSVPAISRYEVGSGGIRAKAVLELLDLYGVTDEDLRQQLADLARQGRVRGWWSAYASVIGYGYSTFIGFEEAAVEILDYGTLIVPGLLQTEGYARAVIGAGLPKTLSEAEVERRVQVRIERQSRLAAGLQLWAIIDESVIRRHVGGRDVMRAQLEHLVKFADSPNVTIQVLPYEAGAYPGMLGAFTILSFEDPLTSPDVVYIEGVNGGDQFLEAIDTRPYSLQFNGLRAVGLDPATSAKMIAAAARDLR
jgi:transcriptional regulator with XRE-family HTH domain